MAEDAGRHSSCLGLRAKWVLAVSIRAVGRELGVNAERSLCLGRREDREQSTEDTCHGDEATQRFPVPPTERRSLPCLARNSDLVRTDVV